MAIMAVLITTELVALSFTIKIFSAVRAYVGGEGLWSKAQKDSAYYLIKYAYTRDEQDYQLYLHFLKVPLSDHQARLALIKNPMDYDGARQGFLGGRIHPDDIDGIIWFFSTFNRIYYIDKAIKIWTQGDSLMNEFLQQGKQLYLSISTHHVTASEIETQLSRIDNLNTELTAVEDEFSYTLGEASRWLENIIFKLLISLAVTVEFTGIFLTIMISLEISRNINAMNKVAKKIGKFDFSERVIVSSHDEIGQLAVSFNTMINELEKSSCSLESSLEEQKKISAQLSNRTLSLEIQKSKTEIERFSKNQLQSILEGSIEYAIIATNLEGVILLWNEGAVRNYGYSADEVVEKENIWIISTPKDIQSGIAQKIFEIALQEGKAEGIFERIRKDGSHFTASAVISLRCDEEGRPLGYVLISKDITKQIQLEEQLIKNNKELEEFAYIASHDLKAPLRAIERLASWIEEDSADTLEDTSKKNLALLRQRVNRMSNLINGILQYSRVGRMGLQIHTVDTKKLVQEVIDSLNPSRNFHIRYSDNLPTLQTDDIPLSQVFSNLISNGLKHHHRVTGNIEIDVQSLGEFYLFSVKDDGPGIEPEYHEKIFQIFQTLKSKDELESTGIGLSIVKKIIESQGGKITVDSKKGEGTVFYFTWPKYPEKD